MLKMPAKVLRYFITIGMFMRVSNASAFSSQAKNNTLYRWLIVNCPANSTLEHNSKFK